MDYCTLLRLLFLGPEAPAQYSSKCLLSFSAFTPPATFSPCIGLLLISISAGLPFPPFANKLFSHVGAGASGDGGTRLGRPSASFFLWNSASPLRIDRSHCLPCSKIDVRSPPPSLTSPAASLSFFFPYPHRQPRSARLVVFEIHLVTVHLHRPELKQQHSREHIQHDQEHAHALPLLYPSVVAFLPMHASAT